MAEVLSIDNLAKNYGRKAALSDLSFKVGAGEVFGLLGPNGSGKTTTLGIILGAVHAGSGSYRWFQSGTSGRERRRIGALLEQPSFYPWLSGSANLKIFAAVKAVPGESAGGSVDQALKTVGLWEARAQSFQTYSLGMKQRLALAATMLGQPECLVLDEPTNGVDAQGIFEIREIIRNYARDGRTVILASHMLDEVEKVCSHVAILKDGKALRTGTIASVLSTKAWLEVSAADPDALAKALAELAPLARIERRSEGYFELHGVALAPAVLNERLTQRGVYLSALAQRQPSLEAQYLQLVGAPTA